MNGQEHYRAAEELLKDTSGSLEQLQVRFAEAQAHATLALVAATRAAQLTPIDVRPPSD